MGKSNTNTDALLDPERVKTNLVAHMRASEQVRARRDAELHVMGLSQKMPTRKPVVKTTGKKKK